MSETISNGRVEVSVKRHGAELCGLKGEDGMEYVWQADPVVWGRHAPVLFPIVGKLAGDCCTVAGRPYSMTQHGFARDMEFDLVESTGDSLAYRLASSPVTRAQYPFDFVLTRRYRLLEDGVEITNEVANPGRVPLLFSIGEHPGFALNWGEGDQIEDYALEFEVAEALNTVLLGADHLLSMRTERVPLNGHVLPLRRDLFDRDALIFLQLASRKVTLTSRKHRRWLAVEFPGFPQLGIWAKSGAPFVCIEPWFGHADPHGHNGELEIKPGIIALNPDKSFVCTWRVRVG